MARELKVAEGLLYKYYFYLLYFTGQILLIIISYKCNMPFIVIEIESKFTLATYDIAIKYSLTVDMAI